MAAMAPTSSGNARLLPHQLVARDDRSSYIRRVETLAGPGAYPIPSTFMTASANTSMRLVHQQQYGREFARLQRTASQSSEHPTTHSNNDEVEGETYREPSSAERRDRYLARRERLRELLQALHERHHCPLSSPSDTTPASPAKTDVGTLVLSSPSLSTTSNYDAFVEGYRHNRRRAKSSAFSPTSSTSDVSSSFSPPPPRRKHAAALRPPPPAPTPTPTPMTPVSYREYLATTSYSTRLHPQRRHVTARKH